MRAAPVPPMVPMGRMHQTRGFVKRSRYGQFVDRRDGVQAAAAAKNNDFVGRRPKVTNGRQSGNSTSVHNNDDAGKTRGKSMLHYFSDFITSSGFCTNSVNLIM